LSASILVYSEPYFNHCDSIVLYNCTNNLFVQTTIYLLLNTVQLYVCLLCLLIY